MNRYLPLLLAAAVLVAGCTAIPGTAEKDDKRAVRLTPSNGLSVQITAPGGTYPEDQPVALSVEATNTGQATARDIQARLYGPSFVDGKTGLGSLAGVDRAAQQPGEKAVHTFSDITHNLQLVTGSRESFTAGVQVSYTTATATFTVVPRDEFQGGSSKVSTDNTAAPVHASIDISSPKPVFGTAVRSTISVPVTIRNVGPGEVRSVKLDASLPNTGSDIGVKSCNGKTSFPVNVRIFQGNS
ncbi:MAG: hypothetical protein ABEK12_01085, partial [Candidatus Nanohaloarchaea archaeon]